MQLSVALILLVSASCVCFLRNVTPACAFVTVFYDPVKVYPTRPDKLPLQTLEAELRQRCRLAANVIVGPPREVELPVCYGGECGPDLAELADGRGFAEEEVVALHSAAVYTVYMLGFAPGFAYLGGLNEKLHISRRPPPGGWRIFGRAPLALFRPEADAPSLL